MLIYEAKTIFYMYLLRDISLLSMFSKLPFRDVQIAILVS